MNNKVVQLQPRDDQRLVLRQAARIAADPQTAVWLIHRILERNAMLLMYGELGTLKSFLALDWALQVADTGEAVVFLSAEGRGLWKRLRAWAISHYPDTPWQETLERMPFYALERPINLSADAVVAQLKEAITALKIAPALAISDTMTRNSDGSPEASNEDAQVFLNRLDRELRAVYQCSVLLVHHVGNAIKDRARGPYSLMANTDGNFQIERPDPSRLAIVCRFGRMKDSESPPPLEYVADVIELDVSEDDQPATSLALRPTGTAVEITPKQQLGKNQRTAVAAVAEWARSHPETRHISSEELNALLKTQSITHRSRRHEAVAYLTSIGVLTPAVAGHTINRGAL